MNKDVYRRKKNILLLALFLVVSVFAACCYAADYDDIADLRMQPFKGGAEKNLGEIRGGLPILLVFSTPT